MWREGGGCEGRVVDLEGGWWMCREGGCGEIISLEGSIEQYDHISAIFHCIALIFCRHQYFLKM